MFKIAIMQSWTGCHERQKTYSYISARIIRKDRFYRMQYDFYLCVQMHVLLFVISPHMCVSH